jgi:hypothetical protein
MTQDIARDLATRYAKCMDDRLFDELDQIMVDDVVMAAPEFESKGLAAFQEQVQLLLDYSATMHLLGNQSGNWDGDNYVGETYCVATHIYEKEEIGRKWEVGIRYDDYISKIGDDYKYTRRYLNVLWSSDVPLQG